MSWTRQKRRPKLTPTLSGFDINQPATDHRQIEGGEKRDVRLREGSNSSFAGDQLDYQQDDRDHEDEMNQTARDMKAEPKQPKDYEDDNERIKHIQCGFLSLRSWESPRV